MGETFVKRALAVKDLLDACADTSAFPTALETQTQCLLKDLDRVAFSVKEAAEAIRSLKGFPAKELACLSDKTMGRIATTTHHDGSHASRSQLQDFMAIGHYYTEVQWEFFLSDASDSEKLDLLLKHANSLGMRNPSESSVQMIVALYLLIVDDRASTSFMKLEIV